VKSAVDSATESTSTYASETAEKASEFADVAAETVNETYGQAKETIADAAEAVGAYAGSNAAYTPRERRPEREGYGGRNNDRGDRGGYGGDRRPGGYGGDRGGYGGDRGMQRGGDREGRAPPERQLVPTSGIYIGNLLFDITAADLEREFEGFGKVTSSVIAADARGLSKGFVLLFSKFSFNLLGSVC
jgi:nucleolin